MPLNKNQRENLEQARYSTGANFISIADLVDIKSDPTLIIALGGTGVDAMLRVKAKVYETFKTGGNASNGRRNTSPDNVRFLVLDTDGKPLSQNTDENGQRILYSYRGVHVEAHESHYIGVEDFDGYAKSKTLQDYIMQWYSGELPGGIDASAGAGGYRVVARLLLFKEVQNIYAALLKVVKELLTSDRATKGKLQVFLLSGISGGTGSGCFLDIAYLLQHAILEASSSGADARKIDDLCSIFAYLIMPDVNIANHHENYLKRNGYAALKELDYLMGIGRRGEKFTQKYSENISVDYMHAPFHLVHLVCASWLKSGNPVESAYERAMLVIAENIAYWLTQDSSASQSGTNALDAFGFYSNVTQKVDMFLRNLERAGYRYPAGYRYGIIGASAKEIPVRLIMLELCRRLFLAVDEMWKRNEPTSEDIKAFTRNSKISEGGIRSHFTQGLPDVKEVRSNPAISMSALKSTGGGADGAYGQWVSTVSVAIPKRRTATYLAALKHGMLQEIQKYFLNEFPDEERKYKYGPAFANALLVGTDGSDGPNLKKFLLEEIDRIDSAIDSLDYTIAQLNQQSGIALQHFHDKIFDKSKHYEAHLKANEAAAQKKLDKIILQHTKEIYEDLKEYVVHLNTVVFGLLYECVLTLSRVFDQNSRSMNDPELFRQNEGLLLQWNVLPEFGQIESEITRLISDTNIKMDDVANAFYGELWTHQDRWLGRDLDSAIGSKGEDAGVKSDAFNALLDFVSRSLQEHLGTSLEAYILKGFNSLQGSSGMDFQAYFNDIFVDGEMKPKADILFPIIADIMRQFESSEVVKRSLISVPAQAAKLSAAFAAYKRGSHLADSDTIQIAATSDTRRVAWNSMIYGIPLYAFANLLDYERAYEAERGSVGSCGFHLYMPTGTGGQRNWTQLPALMPKEVSNVLNHVNTAENERRATLEARFNEALRLGVIRHDDSSGMIVRFTADSVALIEALRSRVNQASTARNAGELNVIAVELADLLDPQKGLGEAQKPLDASARLLEGDTGNDEAERAENAKRYFLLSYDLAERVQVEIEKYKELETLRAAVNAGLAECREQGRQVEIYVNAVLTETLKRNGGIFVYHPNVDGMPDVEFATGGDVAKLMPGYPEYATCELFFSSAALAPYKSSPENDAEARRDAMERTDYDAYTAAIKRQLEELKARKLMADFEPVCPATVREFYAGAVKYLEALSV
jgi:hypothetical protein